MHYDNFRMLAAGRYDSLELSTQLVIIEAELRGHRVEVLDSHDNFIRITGNGKIEYLKQATRTSADSYIAPLIMENKHLTKRILAENGIRVPTGEIFVNEEEAASRYRHWSGTSCDQTEFDKFRNRGEHACRPQHFRSIHRGSQGGIRR